MSAMLNMHLVYELNMDEFSNMTHNFINNYFISFS